MTGPRESEPGAALEPRIRETDVRGTDVREPTNARPLWWLFIGLAAAVILVDQASKAWVAATISPGTTVRLLGDDLRLIYSRNDGALFGLLANSAPVMAAVSVVVIVGIFWYHARAGRSILLSLALGLLLGGAIGNFVDRVRLGYVVDWIDMGLGTTRFWTYNIGDAAVTCSILLILLLTVLPDLRTSAADA